SLLKLIQVYSPVDVPRLGEVSLGMNGLLFTFAVTMTCGLAMGILTGWRSTRATAIELLRSSSATAASAVGPARLRSILVGVEVAATTMCVVAAVLLLSSFFRLLGVERGFDVERIVTLGIALPAARYDAPEKSIRFQKSLVDRVRPMPDVESVGTTDNLPLGGVVSASAIMIEGSSLPRQQRP